MTIEKKLKHFLEASLADSRERSEKIIKDYTDELEKDYAEKCSDIDHKAESLLKLEKEKLIKENNHELAARQIIIKKQLGDAHDKLKDELFNDVRQKLDNFRKTEQYVNLLIKKYKAALEFANGETAVLYLDPDDFKLKKQIEACLNHDLTISEYSFGGGCRTVLVGPQILIDNSFDSIFEEKKNEFTFNGGILNE